LSQGTPIELSGLWLLLLAMLLATAGLQFYRGHHVDPLIWIEIAVAVLLGIVWRLRRR
jgi:hypothetical protein